MAIIPIHPTTLSKLDCKLHYKWSREYRPRIRSAHYDFGIAIHHGLAEYYRDGADPVKAFRQYMKENTLTFEGLGPDDVELGAAMLTNYLKEYKGKERFQTIDIELEIARRIPVPPDDPNPPAIAKDFYVAARIDGLIHDQATNKNFVLEHKTFERFYPNQLLMDHQFVIELFVANGWSKKKQFDGVIYNGLRKKAEKSSSTKLFERHILYIPKRMTDIMLHRVYWELRQIYGGETFPVYPEPSTLKCNWCEFRSPCAAYQNGDDYQFILDNTFEAREDDQDEYVWD